MKTWYIANSEHGENHPVSSYAADLWRYLGTLHYESKVRMVRSSDVHKADQIKTVDQVLSRLNQTDREGLSFIENSADIRKAIYFFEKELGSINAIGEPVLTSKEINRKIMATLKENSDTLNKVDASIKEISHCDLAVVLLDQDYLVDSRPVYLTERQKIRERAGEIPIVVIHARTSDLSALGFQPDWVFPEEGAMEDFDEPTRRKQWVRFKEQLVKRYLPSSAPVSTVGKPSAHYLQKLKIQGFKCFESLEIDFSRKSLLGGRWHCIAGVNGAGKTTILEAICIGLLGPRVAQLGENLVGRKQRDGEETTLELQIEDPQLTLMVPLVKGSPILKGPDPLPAQEDVWDDFWTGFFISLGATRDFSENRKTDKRFSESLRRHLTLFDPLEPAIDDIDFYKGVAPTQVNFVLAKLLHGVLGEFEIDLDSDKSRLNFLVNGKTCPLLELPSGIRSLVILFAAIAREWSRVNPLDDASLRLEDIQGLILIDEIDLHLHPKLQRTVVPRLRHLLPGVQWIVTTHSPLVLSSFDNHEITWLEPNGLAKTLDRQIMGYTPDQVYEFLMETEPMSEIKETYLAFEKEQITNPNAERPKELTPEIINELFVPGQFPELSQDQLKGRLDQWQETVKKFKETGSV